MKKANKTTVHHSVKENPLSNNSYIIRYQDYMAKAKLPEYYGLQKRVVDAIITRVLDPQCIPLVIEDIADDLDISKRTLQRRLGEQDTSFGILRDEVRRHYAVYFLLEKDMPVSDISHKLGFTHRSGFSIAFKRSMGITSTTLKRVAKKAART